MASGGRNYSILVGIKLDTSDVQKQLDEIKTKDIKFKIDVDGQEEIKKTKKTIDETAEASKRAAKEQEKAAKAKEQAEKRASKEQERAAKAAAKAQKDAEKAAKKHQKEVESLGLTYHQANAIMTKSVEIISMMVDSVFELDAAITDFKKVSDLSGQSLDNYVEKLSQMGLEVGRTGKPQGQSRGVWMVNMRRELFKIQ